MASDQQGVEGTPRWNGEPCEAERVRVIVADSPEFPHYWARHLVGTERAAVRVTYGGRTFYIDDDDNEPSEDERQRLARYGMQARSHPAGWGWAKVMAGGGLGMPHAGLKIEREVTDV